MIFNPDPAGAPSAGLLAAPLKPIRPAAQLPKAPPSARRSTNLWDKENRRDALLAVGLGLLSGGHDFATSAANAASNLGVLQDRLRSQPLPQRDIGGPDNTFEIVTDPTTGERTYRPIQAFQDYTAERARPTAAGPRD